MTERKIRELASDRIKSGDWFVYSNPLERLTVNIERHLIEAFAKAARADALDATAALARVAGRHVKRLQRQALDPGQSEELITAPIKTTYHVLRIDGECYISDRQFFPYF